MTHKPKVTVLGSTCLGDTDWHAALPEFDLELHPFTPAEKFKEHIGDAEYVFTSKVVFGEKEFEQCPNLKYIGLTATGYNTIDVVAARKHGVAVCNVPGYSTMSVAQYVITFICNLMIDFPTQSAFFADKKWQTCGNFTYWKAPMHEMADKTLGLIGMGAIGSAVARIAKAFGMRVIAYTPSGIAREPGVEMVDLETLLKTSDVVSLHCPLTKDNEKMMNASTFALMKPTAYFINTARGQLVDEAALADALKRGRLAGAGLDVMATEPPALDNPLTDAPNLLVTPHQAWATVEAMQRLISVLRDNLLAFIDGKPQNVVS